MTAEEAKRADALATGMADLLEFYDGGPGAELGEDARKALGRILDNVVVMQDREQALVETLKAARLPLPPDGAEEATVHLTGIERHNAMIDAALERVQEG